MLYSTAHNAHAPLLRPPSRAAPAEQAVRISSTPRRTRYKTDHRCRRWRRNYSCGRAPRLQRRATTVGQDAARTLSTLTPHHFQSWKTGTCTVTTRKVTQIEEKQISNIMEKGRQPSQHEKGRLQKHAPVRILPAMPIRMPHVLVKERMVPAYGLATS